MHHVCNSPLLDFPSSTFIHWVSGGAVMAAFDVCWVWCGVVWCARTQSSGTARPLVKKRASLALLRLMRKTPVDQQASAVIGEGLLAWQHARPASCVDFKGGCAYRAVHTAACSSA